jgi:hypothetical protein
VDAGDDGKSDRRERDKAGECVVINTVEDQPEDRGRERQRDRHEQEASGAPEWPGGAGIGWEHDWKEGVFCAHFG